MDETPLMDPHTMAENAYHNSLPQIATPEQIEAHALGRINGVAFLEAVIRATMIHTLDVVRATVESHEKQQAFGIFGEFLLPQIDALLERVQGRAN